MKVLAHLERIMNQEAAVIPLMFNAYTVPHVAALQGPVARYTPIPVGRTFLYAHLWEWRS